MEYKFSELFKWQSGKQISPTAGDIPIYGSNGIIGYTAVPQYKNKIILGRVGAYCGSVNYCINEFSATDNTLITTCDESKITYPFASFLLKLINLNLFASGSAQPLITQSILRHLKCNIPILDVQRKIAGILSAYDALIENNNKRIKILERMAENLYREWFVRFRFPGHENTPIVEGLPKSWEIVRYSQVCSIVAGGDYPNDYYDKQTVEYNVPIYSNGIINNGLYGFCKIAQVKEPAITISARGTVGFVALRLKPFLPIVRLLAIIPREFSVYYLYFYAKMAKMEGNGTSQQQLTKPMLNKRKVLMPDPHSLKLFDKQVVPIFEEIENLKLQCKILANQRDELLPRLMSGKLEVKTEI